MSQTAGTLISVLKQNQYNHFSGVPCSLLKGMFALLEQNQNNDLHYIPAVREDSAIGVASGMVLGGHKSVVLMQNSGLGYCLNVLTSFNMIYDIPILLIISWRGAYGNDAVEHDIIGARLTHLLDSVELKHCTLNAGNIQETLLEVFCYMENYNRPAAILVKDEI